MFGAFYVIFMIDTPWRALSPYDWVSPAFMILLTLAVIAVITTFIASFWVPLSRAEGGFRLGKLGLTLLLLGWIWFFNSNWLFPYKQRFEGMAAYYADPVPLRGTVFREYYKGDYRDQEEPLKDWEVEARAESPPLSDAAVRSAWLEHAGASVAEAKAAEDAAAPVAGTKSASKPKLVVVSVSGGALRSAYWTAVVLRRLSREIDGFDKHVRIITGSSGGMLGAACYVEHLYRSREHPNQKGADPECRHLPGSDGECWVPMVNNVGLEDQEDSLNAVAKFAALRELPMAFLPRLAYSWLGRKHELDRGTELERSWNLLNAAERDDGTDPGRRFRDYHALEGQGKLPSLIVSPMIVEDGRLLLISNLDLQDYVTDPGASRARERRLVFTDGSTISGLAAGCDDAYSLYALEFFRLFPGARDFQVRTAVRMNASFPFVSPAVNLPTDPPRRVVDAGYFDNYGVKIAVAWIHMNREWLINHTSGVLLVQIRDELSLMDRFEVDDAPASLGETILGGFQFLSSPLDAANRRGTRPWRSPTTTSSTS